MLHRGEERHGRETSKLWAYCDGYIFVRESVVFPRLGTGNLSCHRQLICRNDYVVSTGEQQWLRQDPPTFSRRQEGNSFRVSGLWPRSPNFQQFRLEVSIFGDRSEMKHADIRRKHVFKDLRPWICHDISCSYGTDPFQSREDWVQHLELQHNLGVLSRAKDCPLCLEILGQGKTQFLKHLCSHFEEISLSSLPTGVSSDYESDEESNPPTIEYRSTRIIQDPRELETILSAAETRQLDLELTTVESDNSRPRSHTNGDSSHYQEPIPTGQIASGGNLGPKIWVGDRFLPQFVRAAEVSGEGLCYFYEDGSHCKAVVNGETVNAHWGVTQEGRPRKRLTPACMACRARKIKCDPDLPSCDQCSKFGRECYYKEP